MDLERLQQALIAADAAGDVASATALANAIRAEMARASEGLAAPTGGDTPGGVSVDQQAAAELGTNISSGVMGARNGMSLGFLDNLKGAVIGGLGGGVAQPDGGIEMFNYGVPMGERYAGIRDQVRAENATAQAEAPGPYALGNIAGAILPGAIAAPELAGASLMRTAATMAGLGAAEGALMGGGNSDAETWGQFATEAAKGGLLGALVGGGAVPVVAGVRGLLSDPVGGLVAAVRGVARPSRAGRVLARTVDRSGMSMDDVQRSLYQAELDGQSVFTVADALGNPGQRTLAGVARSPGDPARVIAEYLDTRQMGQADRVGGFLSDSVQSEQTAAMRAAEAARARGIDAGVNYDAAREAAVPVDVRPALEIIEGRLGPLRGVDIAPSSMDALLARYNARLSVPASSLPPGTNAMELSDFSRVFEVKKDLADDIAAAVRAGRGQEAGLLISLRDALDNALAEASSGYTAARDVYRAQSQAIDAITAGREAARPAIRTDDALATYRGLPAPVPGDLNTLPSVPGGQSVPLFSNSGADAPAGFRMGYVDPLLARMENTTPTTNAARPLTTPKNQAMLQEMVNDPELLARQLAREMAMFETRQTALGGSQTAGLLQDISDVAGSGPTLAEGLLSPRTTVMNMLVRGSRDMLTGTNEKTRQLIAEALLSNDPQAALAPLLRQAMLSGRIDRGTESLLRQSVMQPVFAN
jgi:hypothetical protein